MVPFHHNIRAQYRSNISFIFQFDPTRIHQALTTRHIFDLDYFPAFAFITNFVNLSEKSISRKGSTRDDVVFFLFFTGHRCLLLTVDRVRSSLACRAPWLTINRVFCWIHVPCILIEYPPINGWTIPADDWPLAGHSIEPWTDASDRGLNKGTDRVWTSRGCSNVSSTSSSSDYKSMQSIQISTHDSRVVTLLSLKSTWSTHKTPSVRH